MSLKDQLVARIVADGPISLAEYMAEALMHPQFGYYAAREPFGEHGDFTTAPEISQMFGELLGLCLAQCWIDHGQPAKLTLAELGPGRGTLMRDILHATAAVPGFAPDIVLLEGADGMRRAQRETLNGVAVTWIDRIDEIPEQPLLLIANEFFDALPIRQFRRDGPGWSEVRVGLEDGQLSFGLGQRQQQPMLSPRMDDTQDGDIVEHCPALHTTVATIADRIATHGGAALLVDYGDWRTLGDTFQAVQGHQSVDPLAKPGFADLTAHVDFEAIALAASPARYTRVTPQGVFLERLGITLRAQKLAQGMNSAQLASHIAAHRRLTHPQEMGNLFKVIGLYPDGAAPPPGLEP